MRREKLGRIWHAILNAFLFLALSTPPAPVSAQFSSGQFASAIGEVRAIGVFVTFSGLGVPTGDGGYLNGVNTLYFRYPTNPAITVIGGQVTGPYGASTFTNPATFGVGTSPTLVDTNGDGVNDQAEFSIPNQSVRYEKVNDGVAFEVYAVWADEPPHVNMANGVLHVQLQFGGQAFWSVWVVEPQLEAAHSFSVPLGELPDAGDSVSTSLGLSHASSSLADAHNVTVTVSVDPSLVGDGIAWIDGASITPSAGGVVTDRVPSDIWIAENPGLNETTDPASYFSRLGSFSVFYPVLERSEKLTVGYVTQVDNARLGASTASLATVANTTYKSFNDPRARIYHLDTARALIAVGNAPSLALGITATSDPLTGIEFHDANLMDLAAGEVATVSANVTLREGVSNVSFGFVPVSPAGAGVTIRDMSLVFVPGSARLVSIGASMTGPPGGSVTESLADGGGVMIHLGVVNNTADNVVDEGDTVVFSLCVRAVERSPGGGLSPISGLRALVGSVTAYSGDDPARHSSGSVALTADAVAPILTVSYVPTMDFISVSGDNNNGSDAVTVATCDAGDVLEVAVLVAHHRTASDSPAYGVVVSDAVLGGMPWVASVTSPSVNVTVQGGGDGSTVVTNGSIVGNGIRLATDAAAGSALAVGSTMLVTWQVQCSPSLDAGLAGGHVTLASPTVAWSTQAAVGVGVNATSDDPTACVATTAADASSSLPFSFPVGAVQGASNASASSAINVTSSASVVVSFRTGPVTLNCSSLGDGAVPVVLWCATLTVRCNATVAEGVTFLGPVIANVTSEQGRVVLTSLRVTAANGLAWNDARNNGASVSRYVTSPDGVSSGNLTLQVEPGYVSASGNNDRSDDVVAIEIVLATVGPSGDASSTTSSSSLPPPSLVSAALGVSVGWSPVYDPYAPGAVATVGRVDASVGFAVADVALEPNVTGGPGYMWRRGFGVETQGNLSAAYTVTAPAGGATATRVVVVVAGLDLGPTDRIVFPAFARGTSLCDLPLLLGITAGSSGDGRDAPVSCDPDGTSTVDTPVLYAASWTETSLNLTFGVSLSLGTASSTFTTISVATVPVNTRVPDPGALGPESLHNDTTATLRRASVNDTTDVPAALCDRLCAVQGCALHESDLHVRSVAGAMPIALQNVAPPRAVSFRAYGSRTVANGTLLGERLDAVLFGAAHAEAVFAVGSGSLGDPGRWRSGSSTGDVYVISMDGPAEMDGVASVKDMIDGFVPLTRAQVDAAVSLSGGARFGADYTGAWVPVVASSSLSSAHAAGRAVFVITVIADAASSDNDPQPGVTRATVLADLRDPTRSSDPATERVTSPLGGDLGTTAAPVLVSAHIEAGPQGNLTLTHDEAVGVFSDSNSNSNGTWTIRNVTDVLTLVFNTAVNGSDAPGADLGDDAVNGLVWTTAAQSWTAVNGTRVTINGTWVSTTRLVVWITTSYLAPGLDMFAASVSVRAASDPSLGASGSFNVSSTLAASMSTPSVVSSGTSPASLMALPLPSYPWSQVDVAVTGALSRVVVLPPALSILSAVASVGVNDDDAVLGPGDTLTIRFSRPVPDTVADRITELLRFDGMDYLSLDRNVQDDSSAQHVSGNATWAVGRCGDRARWSVSWGADTERSVLVLGVTGAGSDPAPQLGVNTCGVSGVRNTTNGVGVPQRPNGEESLGAVLLLGANASVAGWPPPGYALETFVPIAITGSLGQARGPRVVSLQASTTTALLTVVTATFDAATNAPIGDASASTAFPWPLAFAGTTWPGSGDATRPMPNATVAVIDTSTSGSHVPLWSADTRTLTFRLAHDASATAAAGQTAPGLLSVRITTGSSSTTFSYVHLVVGETTALATGSIEDPLGMTLPSVVVSPPLAGSFSNPPVPPAPVVVVSAVAGDPDNRDDLLSGGDTVTVTFSRVPEPIASIATAAATIAVDDATLRAVVRFAPWWPGNVTAMWRPPVSTGSSGELALTVVDLAGVDPALPFAPPSSFKVSYAGNNGDPGVTLGGNWGVPVSPEIASIACVAGQAADAVLSAGDSVVITLSAPYLHGWVDPRSLSASSNASSFAHDPAGGLFEPSRAMERYNVSLSSTADAEVPVRDIALALGAAASGLGVETQWINATTIVATVISPIASSTGSPSPSVSLQPTASSAGAFSHPGVRCDGRLSLRLTSPLCAPIGPGGTVLCHPLPSTSLVAAKGSFGDFPGPSATSVKASPKDRLSLRQSGNSTQNGSTTTTTARPIAGDKMEIVFSAATNGPPLSDTDQLTRAVSPIIVGAEAGDENGATTLRDWNGWGDAAWSQDKTVLSIVFLGDASNGTKAVLYPEPGKFRVAIGGGIITSPGNDTIPWQGVSPLMDGAWPVVTVPPDVTDIPVPGNQPASIDGAGAPVQLSPGGVCETFWCRLAWLLIVASLLTLAGCLMLCNGVGRSMQRLVTAEPLVPVKGMDEELDDLPPALKVIRKADTGETASMRKAALPSLARKVSALPALAENPLSTPPRSALPALRSTPKAADVPSVPRAALPSILKPMTQGFGGRAEPPSGMIGSFSMSRVEYESPNGDIGSLRGIRSGEKVDSGGVSSPDGETRPLRSEARLVGAASVTTVSVEPRGDRRRRGRGGVSQIESDSCSDVETPVGRRRRIGHGGDQSDDSQASDIDTVGDGHLNNGSIVSARGGPSNSNDSPNDDWSFQRTGAVPTDGDDCGVSYDNRDRNGDALVGESALVSDRDALGDWSLQRTGAVPNDDQGDANGDNRGEKGESDGEGDDSARDRDALEDWTMKRTGKDVKSSKGKWSVKGKGKKGTKADRVKSSSNKSGKGKKTKKKNGQGGSHKDKPLPTLDTAEEIPTQDAIETFEEPIGSERMGGDDGSLFESVEPAGQAARIDVAHGGSPDRKTGEIVIVSDTGAMVDNATSADVNDNAGESFVIPASSANNGDPDDDDDDNDDDDNDDDRNGYHGSPNRSGNLDSMGPLPPLSTPRVTAPRSNVDFGEPIGTFNSTVTDRVLFEESGNVNNYGETSDGREDNRDAIDEDATTTPQRGTLSSLGALPSIFESPAPSTKRGKKREKKENQQEPRDDSLESGARGNASTGKKKKKKKKKPPTKKKNPQGKSSERNARREL